MCRNFRLQKVLGWDTVLLDKIIRISCGLMPPVEETWDDHPDIYVTGNIYNLLPVSSELKNPVLNVLNWFYKFDNVRIEEGEESLFEQVFISKISDTETADRWKKLINSDITSDHFVYNAEEHGVQGGDLGILIAGLGVSLDELSLLITKELGDSGNAGEILAATDFTIYNISSCSA